MPDFDQKKQDNYNKQLWTSFLSGFLQDQRAQQGEASALQQRELLRQQGRDDKTYDTKVKNFMEMSRSEDPELRKIGFQGLQKLGIIDQVPDINQGNPFLRQFSNLGAGAQGVLAKSFFGDESEKGYAIKGLEGYGDIFSPSNIASYEASKFRTGSTSQDNERKMTADEINKNLTSIDKELGQITGPQGDILPGNMKRFTQLIQQKGYLQAKLESLGGENNQSTQQNILNEVLKTLQQLNQRYK